MKPLERLTLSGNGLSFSALAMGQGPLVLLLHGFPDDFHTWDELMPALAAAGYRAIAPLMRGYEPSSQHPQGHYHLIHLAEDVLAWLDEQGAPAVHLVGHDWGALTAYVTAALAPKRLKSLTTIAIPHLRHLLPGIGHVPAQLMKSSYIGFMQLPHVSEAVVAWDNFAFLEMLWRRWSPLWNFSHEQVQSMKATMAQPGVAPAAIQYYRCLLRLHTLPAQQSAALLRSPLQVPTLALTGENDGCMDTRLYEHLMKPKDFPAGLKIERLPGVGHWLHREAPIQTAALLLDWIRQHP